jgi:hypothetical protein
VTGMAFSTYGGRSRMRVSRPDLHNRRIAVLLCCGIVLLHILVIHPLPYTHHVANASHGHGVVSATTADVVMTLTVIVQSPDHVAIACSNAEWVLPRIDSSSIDSLLEPALDGVMLYLLAFLPARPALHRSSILPLPDGPGRQALLQVFII